MNILALDAGLGFFSVALVSGGVVSSERSDRHDALETGLVRIARLLEAAGLRVGDLDRIAVGTGPGSFTGIRIAVSFAKGLAYGAGVPLIGVSSYDILMPADAPLPAVTLVRGRAGIVCGRLTGIDGGAGTACGPAAEVIARLTSGLDAAVRLTLVAATEDVFPATGEGNRAFSRVLSAAAHNPAEAIAAIASRREAPIWVHALVPDYGEMPAVTVPKPATSNVSASKELR